MENNQPEDTGVRNTIIDISTFVGSLGPMQTSHDQPFAFVMHPAGRTDLKKSTFVWYERQDTCTGHLKIVDRIADVELREMTGEEGKTPQKASECLRAFCQAIYVPAHFLNAPLYAGGTILQTLMQFVGEKPQQGNLQSAEPAEQLPLGIERLWRLTGVPLQKKLEKLEKLIQDGESVEVIGNYRLQWVKLPGSSKILFNFHPFQEPGHPAGQEIWHWSMCVNTADSKFIEQYNPEEPSHMVSLHILRKISH